MSYSMHSYIDYIISEFIQTVIYRHDVFVCQIYRARALSNCVLLSWCHRMSDTPHPSSSKLCFNVMISHYVRYTTPELFQTVFYHHDVFVCRIYRTRVPPNCVLLLWYHHTWNIPHPSIHFYTTFCHIRENNRLLLTKKDQIHATFCHIRENDRLLLTKKRSNSCIILSH